MDRFGWFRIICVFYILSPTPTHASRKYDVELEALKLYKEDIRTVLHRFRRTADYLKIIDSSVKRFMLHTENLAMATLFHYNKKLEQKVMEMMGMNKGSSSGDGSTTTPSSYFKKRNSFRRDEAEGGGGKYHENMVDLLDRYKKLTSKLTVAQKNEMKNLGFMFAGEVIHKIIQSLRESDDVGAGSTKGPGPDDGSNIPASHVSIHEVKGEGTDAGDDDFGLRAATQDQRGHQDGADRFLFRAGAEKNSNNSNSTDNDNTGTTTPLTTST